MGFLLTPRSMTLDDRQILLEFRDIFLVSRRQ